MATSEAEALVPFPIAPPLPLGRPPQFTRRPARSLPGRAAGTTAVLLLYTGGTIGMRKDEKTGAFEPDATYFEALLARGLLPDDDTMPRLSFSAFDPPLDSSDMSQLHWAAIAIAIAEEYDHYDGFVVVHGTDTMAFVFLSPSLPFSFSTPFF
jgi:L-asparaginase/Glu-tRNA(Gln) amidotransferase subunit D